MSLTGPGDKIKLFPGVKSLGKLRNSHDTRFRSCTSSMERECLAPQQKQRNPWIQWRCSSMCFLICFMIHMIFQFCLLFRISCAIETKTNRFYMFLQMVKAVKGNNPRQATQPLKQFWMSHGSCMEAVWCYAHVTCQSLAPWNSLLRQWQEMQRKCSVR